MLRALELLPVGRDAFNGPVLIQLVCGERDVAWRQGSRD